AQTGQPLPCHPRRSPPPRGSCSPPYLAMTSSAATNPEQTAVRAASAALALLLCALFLVGPWTPTARAEHAGLPSPCDLPVVTNVCGAVGNAASSVASATGDFVMRGVTEWVTDAAVWVTGKVGDLVNST